MNRRNEVVALAVKIAALRSELAGAELELDAALGGKFTRTRTPVAPKATGARRGRPPGKGPNLTQRILEGLRASPDLTFRAGAVAQALGARVNTVAVTLGRLAAEGKLLRIAPGQYRHKG
jgi:hypothetical protein